MQLFFFLILLGILCNSSNAQIPLRILEKVKQIRLLESTPENVEKLLAPESFTYSSSENHHQTFWTDKAVISVKYASGKCTQEEYQWNDWNVPEWVVVRILIRPKEAFSINEVSVNLHGFRKEHTDWQRKQFYIYFNKDMGVAISFREREVDTIHFFPPKEDHPRLCNAKSVRSYYASKKWIRLPDQKKAILDYNSPANVIDLLVTKREADPREYSVETRAEDSDYDILTYIYKVSGGRIIGSGENVIWDLASVEPGTYSITAAADDGCGPCGRFVTRSLVIK